MEFDFGFVKRNWYYFAGGIIGLFVVYELVKSAGASSSSASTDTSGFVGASGGPVNQLQASADIAASGNNAQIQTANFQAQVSDNAIAAELALGQTQSAEHLAESLATTSASRDVALAQTQADVQKTALTTQGAVDVQSIITGGQVEQTQIEGQTLVDISGQQTALQSHMIDVVGSQIAQIQAHSKHASQDYTAIAPILAIETGQQGAAAATAQANAESRVAGSGVAATAITSGAGVINQLTKTSGTVFQSIAKGLFGGGA
jgi:hypothetical protein